MNDFSKWGHPRLLPAHPLKRWLAVAAGGLLCSLMPGVAAQLRRGEKPLSAALRDRLMAAFLIDSRLRRGRLAELSHFHQQFWESDYALAAHAEIEQHFDSWLTRTEGLINELEKKGKRGRYG